MKPSVVAAFPTFTDRFEGHIPFMYLDVKGLVTTGRGNLIDPLPTALGLPWELPMGVEAQRSDIVAAWNTVKSRTDLSRLGGMAFGTLTNLRLTNQAIDDLTTSKANEMWSVLVSRFANLESCPADAQLGVLSLAWACGPHFNFPKFEAALLANDFVTCSKECVMNAAGNPGLVPRNNANVKLFLAASVTTTPDVLS